MRVAGIGIDIVEIARIAESIERHGESFLSRLFTANERDYCESRAMPAMHYAARFAAKEAVAKALGTGIGRGVSWQDITIFNDENGAPKARLTGGALDRLHLIGAHNCHLSISDEQRYATAFVVLD